ncbi:hypothetical protein VTN49DRAFT_2377 [Thermomyces lanuginosus]|uniref:uncharacterized protein n=1 Tax=Thermomyces lanuginosus TaxID=5541 RepID=UPI0037433FC3
MANISRTAQDDEMSTQDGFSYSSSLQSSHDMDHWTLSAPGSMESSPVMPQPKTPEVQMLPYSFPHQSMLPSGGLPDSTGMFPSLSDLHAGGASEMEYAQPGQDFSQAFSSMVDFPFDESQSCMNDDCASMGNSALHEDGSWKMSLDTGDFPTTTYESVTAGTTAPVSPPLTEASNVSMASGPAYTLPGHDETIRGEKDSGTVRGPTLSMEESAHPLTPPLNDQDPNKTIRPSRQAQRPSLSAASPSRPRKSDPEVYTQLSMRESVGRSKDNSENRSPRDHPYYSLPPQSDGKYYCPFSTGENPCHHPPTTQKCAYHKYLDSHLKPYRCKVPACVAQNLHFSSNACLFRHEREAHGLHGHGDNPHLCLFEGCDRSIPGYGFPRRWNLFDHMKRVHDYSPSDQPSSPDTASSGSSKKKDNTVRKRKVTKAVAVGTQTMKRSRSTSGQGGSPKTHAAHHSQRLQNAERNYYNCRSRLLEELSNITPQDSAMHEKVNASLQELITLGLNYRQLEASCAATQLAKGGSTSS